MTNGLFDLTSRVAIVTGTSRGLGQCMSRALARAGADLILTSRNRDHLLSFESEIKALGRRAVSLQLDVRSQSSIEHFAKDAEAAYGRVDILVNNAGCNVRKPALEVTWDDWNLILDTNLRGSFLSLRLSRASWFRATTAASSTSAPLPALPVMPGSVLWCQSWRRPAINDELGR